MYVRMGGASEGSPTVYAVLTLTRRQTKPEEILRAQGLSHSASLRMTE
jgi:hypothetical protein